MQERNYYYLILLLFGRSKKFKGKTIQKKKEKWSIHWIRSNAERYENTLVLRAKDRARQIRINKHGDHAKNL